MAQQIDFGVFHVRGIAAELGSSSTPTRQGQERNLACRAMGMRISRVSFPAVSFANTHVPTVAPGGLRSPGCPSRAPQVLSHPPAAPSRRAHTKGGCSRTLPVPGCARADPRSLRAAAQSWGSNVRGCPGAHREGTVTLVGSSGSTANPPGLGKKDPSRENPRHPSPQHGQVSPSWQSPPRCPCRAVGRGCRRSLRRLSLAAFRAGEIPAGARPKPTHSLQSGFRLSFPTPAVRGGGEGAQTHGSCPPQPGSLRNQLRDRGVRARLGEQRVGMRWFSHGRRFPAPSKASGWRHGERSCSCGDPQATKPGPGGGRESAGNAPAGIWGDEEQGKPSQTLPPPGSTRLTLNIFGTRRLPGPEEAPGNQGRSGRRLQFHRRPLQSQHFGKAPRSLGRVCARSRFAAQTLWAFGVPATQAAPGGCGAGERQKRRWQRQEQLSARCPGAGLAPDGAGNIWAHLGTAVAPQLPSHRAGAAATAQPPPLFLATLCAWKGKKAAPKSLISSPPPPSSQQRELNLMLLVRQCLAGCAALQADGETN